MYCFIFLLLCFVGYYLLAFYSFVSLVKTFIIEFMLVHLFITILVMDFSSVFIASTSFWRLLLVTSRVLDRSTLIGTPFASETALRGPL
jgi:hypothetical protein